MTPPSPQPEDQAGSPPSGAGGEPWPAVAAALEATKVALAQSTGELRHDLILARRSRAWRATAPLRALRGLPARGKQLAGRVPTLGQQSRSAAQLVDALASGRARSARPAATTPASTPAPGPAGVAIDEALHPDVRWTERQVALVGRLNTVAAALDPGAAPGSTPPEAIRVFTEVVQRSPLPVPALAWYAAVAAYGHWPDDDELDPLTDAADLDGPGALCDVLWDELTLRFATGRAPLTGVEVVRGGVLADITHTASHDLHTGIQRVVRETVERWWREHGVTLVAWEWTTPAPRRLTPAEVERCFAWRERVDHASPVAARSPVAASQPVLVPVGVTWVLPELVTGARCGRYRTFARAGVARRLSAIAYDTIPAAAAETVIPGMAANYAAFLSAARSFDALVTISHAVAGEYRGIVAMLSALGLRGPRVVGCPLPAERPPAPATPAAPPSVPAAPPPARDGASPTVLVVGSHEPRKNHVVVLLAAERLWRAGRRFRLLFLGGNSWASEPFEDLAAELRRAGRPIEIVHRASEDLLWEAYPQARCTVLASLVEGFGLPIVESLVSGTPVITSSCGSMAELAQGGGVVTVEPRDVNGLAEALRLLLTDDTTHERLVAEARARTFPTWDDYAATTWELLTRG